jgi:hypothetical protein
MEHWLGSHPSLLPCDICPGACEWNYDHLPDSETPWASDLKTAPWVPFNETKLSLLFLQNQHKNKEWFCGPRRLLEHVFLCNDELPPPQSYTWTMCDEANHTCPVPTNPSHAWMLHSLVRLSHSTFSEAPKGQVNPDPNPLCCVQAATLLTPVVCKLKSSKLAVALPAPQLLGSPESCCSATLNGAFVVMP